MLAPRQVVITGLGAAILTLFLSGQQTERISRAEIARIVLRHTRPLEHSRGTRLPLLIWGLRGAPSQDQGATEQLLRDLDERGIALLASWIPGKNQNECLQEALRIARLQVKLGLSVGVDAIRPVYTFFNGDIRTAHVDRSGKPFYDFSFDEKKKIGCPFSVQHRYPIIRRQVEFFADGYKASGVPINFVFSDWEVDGPIEWNDGWANARKCVRCIKQIRDIDDFAAFQRAYRKIRSEMQRECYARPILERFPEALVGNYGVYPNDNWRYWYDWFEECRLDLPHKLDHREPQRPWVNEFNDTGYTFAMPVMYTWYRTFDWYDFKNPDYRWFYNMLKIASNSGQNTPRTTPIISFIHHTLTRHSSEKQQAHVKPMSLEAYRELLWHAILRGHDGFFLWCPDDQISHEIGPVHEVWAASLEFAEFLGRGTPITFDVPKTAGTIISGLRIENRVLVRRTDFGENLAPVTIRLGDEQLSVPRRPEQCQILRLTRKFHELQR